MARNVFANPISSYLSGYMAADDMIARNKELRSRLRREELNRAILQQRYDLDAQLNPYLIKTAQRRDALEGYLYGEPNSLSSTAPIAQRTDAETSKIVNDSLNTQFNLAERMSPYGIQAPLVDIFKLYYPDATPTKEGIRFTGPDGNEILSTWESIGRVNPKLAKIAAQIAQAGARANAGQVRGVIPPGTVSSALGLGGPASASPPTTPPVIEIGRPSHSINYGSQLKKDIADRIPKPTSFMTPEDMIENVQQFLENKPAVMRSSAVNPIEYYGVDSVINALGTIESNNNPNAVSPAGAIGLMQVKVPTAMDPGVSEVKDVFTIADQLGIPYPDRSEESAKQLLFNPDVNRTFGINYLVGLTNRYGDLNKALAAYNWGLGRLDKHLAANNGQLVMENLPKQTRDYILKFYETLFSDPKVLAQNVVAAY